MPTAETREANFHGDGVPCRHCLKTSRQARTISCWLSAVPRVQPYAETGPIFLHAEECERAEETETLPELFGPTPDYIVRGYSADDRIVYGTGAVVPTIRFGRGR